MKGGDYDTQAKAESAGFRGANGQQCGRGNRPLSLSTSIGSHKTQSARSLRPD